MTNSITTYRDFSFEKVWRKRSFLRRHLMSWSSTRCALKGKEAWSEGKRAKALGQSIKGRAIALIQIVPRSTNCVLSVIRFLGYQLLVSPGFMLCAEYTGEDNHRQYAKHLRHYANWSLAHEGYVFTRLFADIFALEKTSKMTGAVMRKQRFLHQRVRDNERRLEELNKEHMRDD